MLIDRCWFLFILSAVVGCSEVSSRELPTTPNHFDVFVDRTGSISGEARTQWRAPAGVLVAQLAEGDSVDIYDLHGRTIEAGAVLSQGTFLPPVDPTVSEVLRGRTELTHLREHVRETMQRSLAGPVKTDGTDVIGFVERVRVEPGRRTRVVLFTDAVNETPDLDLAKKKLTEAGIPATITDLARGRHWTHGQLNSVEVAFVLNAAKPSDKRPLNDRRMLRLFYEQLVGALGGTVSRFDTGLVFSPVLVTTTVQR